MAAAAVNSRSRLQTSATEPDVGVSLQASEVEVEEVGSTAAEAVEAPHLCVESLFSSRHEQVEKTG